MVFLSLVKHQQKLNKTNSPQLVTVLLCTFPPHNPTSPFTDYAPLIKIHLYYLATWNDKR